MATPPPPPPEATNDIDDGLLIGSAIGVAIVLLAAFFMLWKITFFIPDGSWWKENPIAMIVRPFCWILLFAVFPLSYALWIDHYDNVGNNHSDRQELVYWMWVGLASAVAFTCCAGFLRDVTKAAKNRKSRRSAQAGPMGGSSKPTAAYDRQAVVPPRTLGATAQARNYIRPGPSGPKSKATYTKPAYAADNGFTERELESDLASGAPLLAMPLVPPASP
tara:strand:+ start:426 stop:1085 length:660 start_codon:yes stop_codon:yes gene_type:complete